MNPLDLITEKKTHLARLANQRGAAGESSIVETKDNWVPRPRGVKLKRLLNELEKTGVSIKWSSFDAIALSESVDFEKPEKIQRYLPEMVFIEIKTANQDRVKPGFKGFFFAITENEIHAADQLGHRYRVALFNAKSGEIVLTSVAEILARSKSMTWQVSVQL